MCYSTSKVFYYMLCDYLCMTCIVYVKLGGCVSDIVNRKCCLYNILFMLHVHSYPVFMILLKSVVKK